MIEIKEKVDWKDAVKTYMDGKRGFTEGMKYQLVDSYIISHAEKKAWEVKEFDYCTPWESSTIKIESSGVHYPKWAVYVPTSEFGDVHEYRTFQHDYIAIGHDHPDGYGVMVYTIREVDYIEAMSITVQNIHRMGTPPAE